MTFNVRQTECIDVHVQHVNNSILMIKLFFN